MSKRKKYVPAIKGKEDGTLLPVARTLRKKHFQPGRDQSTDTAEEECKIMTEKQGTEDIGLKPREDEEPITMSHNMECKKQRTDLIIPEVEEKDCRVNESQEEEYLSLPLTQNSTGRYVPVFPKPKNKLIHSDSLKNVMVKMNKESANSSKTEGDDSSHNMVLESSGFCLAATKHQVQVSQQPSEQITLNSSHLNSKVSGEEQQETLADEDCIQQGSNSRVSLSGMQVGADFVDHAIEGLTCNSDPINSDVTEVRNKSSKMNSHQHEMDVLCSSPIPIAHSTAFRRPLTQSEHKTRNLSSSFSDREPGSEQLHHSFYQEKIDKVPVTHEELALSQSEQRACTIVINKNADKNVESSTHTPGVLRNFSCGEKTHNVVCEEIEVNKQKPFVQMNLVTDLFAESDLKEATCSQPVDLSLDTNAENQLENCDFNSQPSIMDEHQNVNKKLPVSPNSVRNCVLKNYDDCQSEFNGNWSDRNVPDHALAEVTDNIILHKGSGDQDVKLQQQLNQCFLEVERMEIELKMHPGDQTELDIARNHEYQKIIQISCETFHGCGDNMEGCNSVNCGNAGEETRQLIQETISQNHGSGAISTDCADQKCNSPTQCQGRLGEQCIEPSQSKFLETQLANSVLSFSQTDMSKSLVDFKMRTRNGCSSEPEPHLESGNTGPQQLNTIINPLQTAVYPVKNEEVISDSEVNSHQIHFSKGAEDTKEQMVNKRSLATTREVTCNELSSLDNLGFWIESHVNDIEDSSKVDLNRREIQHKVSIKIKNEDIIAALQLSGSGMEDDADRCHQKEKVKQQIQDGGNMECGGVTNNGNEESSVEEHTVPSSMDHPKEEESLDKSGTSDQTVFSMAEMDLQLGYDLVTGDKNTLPRSGPNLTTISVVSSQYQSEDFTARHGGLSMAIPTSSVNTADASSVHRKTNTKTDHRINNVNECKGYSLSVVDERSSSKAQERINAQHVSAPWTVNQRDESEQNPCLSTNCETSKPIPDKVQPDDKGYELRLIKPVMENKDVMDVSLLIAPQDKANFTSEMEDLHLSEADWQALSSAEEEDATHVVCGLINELSKINRIIMITHRELESMKRHKNRKARPVGRHPHFSKGSTNIPYLLKRKDP